MLTVIITYTIFFTHFPNDDFSFRTIKQEDVVAYEREGKKGKRYEKRN